MAKDRFCKFQVERDQLVFGTNKNKVLLLNANTGEPIWIKRLKANLQSWPIFGGFSIFVGSYGGDVGAKYPLTRLERETGKLIWEQQGDGAFWRPSLHDGMLYVGSTDKKLYAFKPETGKMKWSFEVATAISTAGLSIGEGNIYFSTQSGVSSKTPRTIHAVNIETGEAAWAFDNQIKWLPQWLKSETFLNDPIFFEGTVYATGGSNLFALDPKTGKKKWVLDAKTQYPLQAFKTQCINEKYICFTSSSTDIIIADPKKGEIIRRIKASSYATALFDSIVYWSDKDGAFYAFDLESGQEKWSREFEKKMFCAPIVQDDKLFVYLDDTAYCLHKETGEIIWSFTLPQEDA